MIEHDVRFLAKRHRFYEDSYRGTERIDPWHAYSQKVTHTVTRDWFSIYSAPDSKILNAGSGGSDYGIESPMVHLDLIPTRIRQFPAFIVADISSIPTNECSYDVVLCVGSVLNYSNPIRGIQEIQRVLRPGGLLILEYERSGSAEYWWAHGKSAPCVRVDTFYGKTRTQLWVYGDEFIDGLLTVNGLEVVRESRFHSLSTVILALTKSPAFATRFVWADSLLANSWPFRCVSSNRILAIKKLAN